MGDFTQFQEPVWDRFFDFIFECDEDLNRAEVQEELRRRGIDVTRAVNRCSKRSAPPRRGRRPRWRERAVGVLPARARGISLTDIGGSLEESEAADRRAVSGPSPGRLLPETRSRGE